LHFSNIASTRHWHLGMSFNITGYTLSILALHLKRFTERDEKEYQAPHPIRT
jgi:hypothetical protein